jgi:hypothetical protein
MFRSKRRLSVRQLHDIGSNAAQVMFHLQLILTRRWNNRRVPDESVVVRFIAMVQDAAGRFGDRMPDAGSWAKFNIRP